jgi:hypothetical protein
MIVAKYIFDESVLSSSPLSLRDETTSMRAVMEPIGKVFNTRAIVVNKDNEAINDYNQSDVIIYGGFPH